MGTAVALVQTRKLIAVRRWGLTMADIDQLSMMLGGISSDIKTLYVSLADHKSASALQHSQIRDQLKLEIDRVVGLINGGDEAIRTETKDLKVTTDDYQKNKYKIIGGLTVLSLLSGFIGTKVQLGIEAIRTAFR